MIPIPDLADLASFAEARSAKTILAGNTGQLHAVENGDAMSRHVIVGRDPRGSNDHGRRVQL
jgi:hypothetical protein